MIQGKKLIVVLPAYNAEATLRKTHAEIPFDIVDDVILVDDASDDRTTEVAHELGIRHIILHGENRGYGGNQKTCYDKALQLNADIIVMLHPDYQYTPKLIPAMAGLVASGLYSFVLGSRILGGQALKGGMPAWRYAANRGLTLVGNLLLGTKLSEFHTGYRAFSRDLLERLPLDANSDDFVFDNEVLAEAAWLGFPIGEISCPTRYMPEASSISFRRSVRYGFGCLATAIVFRLAKLKLVCSRRFPANS